MDIQNKENTSLFYHKTVMVDEVLHYLDPQPQGLYCDVTFGSGGHTKAILNKQPECRVVAIDWDATSIETYAPALEEQYQERLHLLWGNFSNLYRLLQKAKVGKVDGILADFGTSQMHIKERAGFSFYRDSELDMRMSPAHQQVTAEQVINKSSEEKLCEIFWQLGQESHAKKIVAAIIEARQKKAIRTTRELAALIEKVIPRSGRSSKIHPATKVFQALRIYVNHELNNITGFLSGALQVLKPNGLLLCISFHSLEDRLVKQFFKDQADAGKLEIITKRVVVPTAEEIAKNPSSRSAKLRVARFIG
ncbi:MAG TPA: 16S rRNA (cytosine(1402)-N(4))-methyltransferase RsmH [Candidatus Babeliales bacterium]|jgi:16S rRNA (cytosine1402-N4)-methyltransferase|nr:16S rRNA (cytosine(1402)-N(4))-methyltransferase RsmH [Candidatus Babeliales bacterium]